MLVQKGADVNFTAKVRLEIDNLIYIYLMIILIILLTA